MQATRLIFRSCRRFSRLSHLPVIIDPSHASGHAYMVEPLARAGVAVGADGLIIEVHPRPEEALCDGAQALTREQFLELFYQVRKIYEVTAKFRLWPKLLELIQLQHMDQS